MSEGVQAHKNVQAPLDVVINSSLTTFLPGAPDVMWLLSTRQVGCGNRFLRVFTHGEKNRPLKFRAGYSQQSGTVAAPGMMVQTNVAISGLPLIIAPPCAQSSGFSMISQVPSPYSRKF
jgi:hypothetical protein